MMNPSTPLTMVTFIFKPLPTNMSELGDSEIEIMNEFDCNVSVEVAEFVNESDCITLIFVEVHFLSGI